MPEAAVPTITLDELRAMLDDPAPGWWLIHATDRAGFHERHLPGALARPHDAQLRRLGRTARIVVYGEDEHATTAPALAAALGRIGIQAAWFAGGLTAWSDAGLALERSG